MGEVKIEIDKAIKALGLTTMDIVLLEDVTGEALYQQLLDYFVKSGDRRWWWEDFRQESFSFVDSDRHFDSLNQIIPKTNEKVWLMVEDDQEKYYPIYDAKPEVIGVIIGECFGFEYYIIDKNKDWLICENHHDRLIGIGEILRTKNTERIAG